MKKIYHVQGVLGGSTFYDENSNYLGFSLPGIGGGEDFFFDTGETGYTVDSIISGQDYYGSDGKQAHTIESVLGGEGIYGDIAGFRGDSPFGSSDIFINDDPML